MSNETFVEHNGPASIFHSAPDMAVESVVTLPDRPPMLTPAVVVLSTVTTGNPRVLRRLLQMADSYRSNGSLHNAIEIYFELVEQHGESLEAQLAEERVMEVAERYERTGELHLARALYERLL